MFLLNTPFFGQNKKLPFDTTFLYFPHTILFDYNSFKLVKLEEQKLNFIFNKYYFPDYLEGKSSICLTVLECPDEISENKNLSMLRLWTIYQFLTKNGVNKYNIFMQIGGPPNPQICSDKAKQGVIIQYCIR